MFESFKKTLGFTSTRQESKGYRLGTAADNAPSSNPARPTADVNANYELFDRLFHGQKLGMTILNCQERLPIDNATAEPSRPQVDEVHPTGEAAKLGICRNDIVIALNDSRLQDFHDFYDIIPALERPVKISFYRAKPVQPTASVGIAPSVPPSLISQETVSSIFNFRGNITGNQQPTAVSEEDLQARREERLRAVNDRTQAIEKKFKKSSSSTSSKSPTANGSTLPKSSQGPASPTMKATSDSDETTVIDPETQKIVQQVKAEEHRMEQSLGYNPFVPHMSFSGNAATASLASSNPTSSSSSSGNTITSNANNNTAVSSTSPAVYVEEDPEIIAEVDDSFAMLLSLTDNDQDRAKMAVQTAQKLLLNLYRNKQELKFRVIRMSNKAFYNKVVTVPGGIELLLAAGFRLETGDVLDSSSAPSAPSPATKGKEVESEVEVQDALNDAEPSDSYLLHTMDAYSERKLNYTVSRLQELLDMQQAV